MDLNVLIKSLSLGKTEVITDGFNEPNIMVKIPKFKISDVITGGENMVHPAFIVNGVEKDAIYISKYLLGNTNGAYVSRANLVPANCSTYSFATSICQNKGTGWHMLSLAEYSAIALWCYKNGIIPDGNNQNGASIDFPTRKGVIVPGSNNSTYSGMSPRQWSHDGTSDGIFDIAGNLADIVSGVRIVNGEIQIIENNNIASNPTTLNWRAILEDGSLVSPGIEGTLKIGQSGITKTTPATINLAFSTMANNGIVIPNILKYLTLFPQTNQANNADVFEYTLDTGVKYLSCGGHKSFGVKAGIFNRFNVPESPIYNCGVRAAYII